MARRDDHDRAGAMVGGLLADGADEPAEVAVRSRFPRLNRDEPGLGISSGPLGQRSGPSPGAGPGGAMRGWSRKDPTEEGSMEAVARSADRGWRHIERYAYVERA